MSGEDLSLLTEQLKCPSPLVRALSVSGGCIHRATKLESVAGHAFFVKSNTARTSAEMFAAEAEGLQLLRSQQMALRIPEVLLLGKLPSGANFLVLEWIAQGPERNSFWEDFGMGLAALHRLSNTAFGWKHDNFIGSLPQSNEQETEWAVFYIRHRIIPQLELGVRNGYFSRQVFKATDRLFLAIDRDFPKEVPSLLHGDLWSGNFLCDTSAKPVLIDPAVYFGNRETEMAFTRLFGGFSPAFYAAYASVHPLQEDWEQRIDVHQLYPLLVHANLFGGAYIRQSLEILEYY